MSFLKIITLLLLATSVVLADQYDFVNERRKNIQFDALISYNRWKFNNKRAYLSDEERTFRQLIFFENYQRVQEHNSKNKTYEIGVNQFSDMTQEEFESRMLNTFVLENNPRQRDDADDDDEDEQPDIRKLATLPRKVDWRTKGAVTSVKNQGSCGSCWAFSTTGLLEGINVLRNRPLTSFSEQQLLDCCTKNKGFKCQGCNGAWPTWALDYVKKFGVLNQSAYPYIGAQSACKVNSPTKGIYISEVKNVGKSVDALKAAVSIQPVSVVIHATYWSGYKSGVFNKCQEAPQYGNHAVLLVGYTEKGEWIVKNSWGAAWGVSGYITLAPGNTCGIFNNAVVAKI